MINSKFKVPNSKQITISKYKNCFEFKTFEFCYYLRFVILDLLFKFSLVL